MKTAPGWLRTVWLLGALATVGVASLGLTLIYRQPELITIPIFRQFLAEINVSLDVATVVSFVLPITFAAGLAATVFLNRRNDSFALLFALASLGFFVYFSGSPRAIALVLPQLAAFATAFEVVFVILTVFMFFMFPNGRFVSRWSRAFAYGLALTPILMPWLPATLRMMAVDVDAIAPSRRAAATTIAMVLVVTAIATQSIRYRRHSTPVERQQIRWVLFGFLIILIPATGVPLGVALHADRPVAWMLLTMAVAAPVVPITAAIAILRFRLFDLDRVVSLTISWAALTVLLLGCYLLSVFALQAVLRPMTGESELAVAASTLAVAALFSPARRQVQRLVDRRFHRSHYDAKRTVERFGSRLQSHVDSRTLTRDLTAVTVDTLQPVQVSVWLRS